MIQEEISKENIGLLLCQLIHRYFEFNDKLISSLFINYLDHLYKENGICTDIYINWPIVPSIYL